MELLILVAGLLLGLCSKLKQDTVYYANSFPKNRVPKFSSHRPAIPSHIKEIVWNRDGGKCQYCDSVFDIEFDHIIPWSRCKSHDSQNLQLLCKKCNREKSDKVYY